MRERRHKTAAATVPRLRLTAAAAPSWTRTRLRSAPPMSAPAASNA